MLIDDPLGYLEIKREVIYHFNLNCGINYEFRIILLYDTLQIETQ